MQLGYQEKEIGSSVYLVRQMRATPALDLLLELGRTVGPALGILIDKAGKGKSLTEAMSAPVSGDAFGRAVEMLVSRLDTPKVQGMITSLRAVTEVDREHSGKFVRLGEVYEMHFHGGNLGELFGWLRFALEVQFGDFFESLASLAPPASGLAAPAHPAA